MPRPYVSPTDAFLRRNIEKIIRRGAPAWLIFRIRFYYWTLLAVE